MFEKQRNDKTVPASSSASKPVTETPAQESSPPNVRRSALIGSSIKITGDVVGDENLIIDGSVEGSVNLSSNELVIGQSGRINANMTANMIRVDGEVKGDINGNEKVIVSKTGRVQGNIVAPRVTLEDGAKFKGSIDMDPGGIETSKPKPAKAGASSAPTGEVSEILEKASSGTGG